MREIKVRVWNGKEMEYFTIDNEFDCIVGWLEGCIISLYTGLNDKNGKEIYEGDILCIPQQGYDHIKNEIIDFKNKYIHVEWELSEKHQSDRNGQSTTLSSGFKIRQNRNSIEVVGNIHKNPELLYLC